MKQTSACKHLGFQDKRFAEVSPFRDSNHSKTVFLSFHKKTTLLIYTDALGNSAALLISFKTTTVFFFDMVALEQLGPHPLCDC